MFAFIPGVFTHLVHTTLRIKYLNRPKRLIRFLPPRKQETDNFFNIIPRPKNEIHLLSTANYILQKDKKEKKNYFQRNKAVTRHVTNYRSDYRNISKVRKVHYAPFYIPKSNRTVYIYIS